MRIAFMGDSLTAGAPGCSYFAILRERLAGHTLINLGQGNDTVISLYRRMARLRFGERWDVVFLWVGVNDVPGKIPLPFQIANAMLRTPRSKSLDEFRAYYESTLDLLCRHAKKVIAVSPLMKGEDLSNEWNLRLGDLAREVEGLAARHERAEYLDLRPTFAQRLAGKSISSYLPDSALRTALDTLTLRSKAQVDKKAAERGLNLTLDGLHLNSAGAELVAETFIKAIGDDSAVQASRLARPRRETADTPFPIPRRGVGGVPGRV
jgi:lysophospholipase L1-like esterase